MSRAFIRRFTIACPFLFTLAACDEDALAIGDDGDEIEFRTCPPACTGGDWGNTSYAGEWSLANINTGFGVPAANSLDGDASTATLTSAQGWFQNGYHTAGLVDVTADGELRLHYQVCFGNGCVLFPQTGAQVVGSKLYFQLGDGMETDTYWVRVHAYETRTIHNKTAHVYTLTTNAPNGTPQLPDESRPLCYANSAGENSARSVFLPGVQLDAELLTIDAATNGAIIACETGADGKIVLGFGYHPTDLATSNRYTGALKMTTGDICGTGHAYTSPGRLINIQDSLGINSWSSGSLTVREGDYDHTGMICRGTAFRGQDGVQLNQMLLQAPCLQEMPFCGSTLTSPGVKTATFGVKVEGGIM
ncbi:ADYC domain-containing protein [Nannocystis bainbridge]|uniref:ADYC domain-containing protein n=1 Tax=Nannocystis bainbridge TaxID=2995303 RepID=A0ABT5E5L4_9BACT|nr:ADYC domain-containing protein [Nannocystis bainbridge]MDC0721144.1 ADYC domain-containing protein [Nannocystis bainbridge]